MEEKYKEVGKNCGGEILGRYTEETGYNRSYAVWLLSNWGRKRYTVCH